MEERVWKAEDLQVNFRCPNASGPETAKVERQTQMDTCVNILIIKLWILRSYVI